VIFTPAPTAAITIWLQYAALDLAASTTISHRFSRLLCSTTFARSALALVDRNRPDFLWHASVQPGEPSSSRRAIQSKGTRDFIVASKSKMRAFGSFTMAISHRPSWWADWFGFSGASAVQDVVLEL
jgi:hypothetical protein